MKTTELQKTLNWLLSLGIIDANLYNDLYLRSLPYLKK